MNGPSSHGLGDLDIPAQPRVSNVVRLETESTNLVFRCVVTVDDQDVPGFLKVARKSLSSGEVHPLQNEIALLARMSGGRVPMPRVLAAASEQRPYLLAETLPGDLVWDRVDPRRPRYCADTALEDLRAYGAMLARVHALPTTWAIQGRASLESLLGEQDASDRRFQSIVGWLNDNEPAVRVRTFVHGDFNVANVLLHEGAVSGVIDWEFAGVGWREFDLAWALRARTHFLCTDAERNAVLSGYVGAGAIDVDALRWCEVLNYLHFAFWQASANPAYTEFALARAESLIVG